MIVHLCYTLDVLCGDDGRLASVLVQDDTAQMNDAVTNDDVQPAGAPVGLLDRLNNAITDVIVIGRWIGNLARKTCYRLKQIGTADPPDDFVASEHRQPLDMSPLPEGRNPHPRPI